MQDILGASLRKLKKIRIRKTRMIALLLVLSLIVSTNVFLAMRKPGLTLAGNADCGITEHTHDENCFKDGNVCTKQEHVHGIDCYSDKVADNETMLDWQKMFKDYPYTGDLAQDLLGIAKTQVGYQESTLNFEVGKDGIRRGYTRYGAWYGTPYSDWSAMFVSFCLKYAKADLKKYPINTGANSMAKLWNKQNRYAPADKYKPTAGDLVFFKNNTVGIVAEVYNSTFYVIRGDIENAVQGDVMSLADENISGWGIINGTYVDSDKLYPENPLENTELDISNGPAVFIREGEGTAAGAKMQTYSLRRTRAITDLIAYLQANGGNYFFTLLDKNNQELPKDASGNYIVQADTGYKLTLSFTAPKGFLPGTYQYQIPNGLLVDGGEGTFILKDGTNVGSWVVTDEGLITLDFNEHINSRTDITISATLGIHFPQQDDPIDFDGKITVTVEKPPPEVVKTKVYKWGSQGVEAQSSKNDPTKIYWTVDILGFNGSNIVGSVITDRVTTAEYLGTHHYTPSDMARGLSIGVAEYDLVTGESINWHSWTVYPGDPNLTWTEDGWSYKMPETAICDWCGKITLGNNGWEYYIDYSSTPLPSGVTGTLSYMNYVTVDNQVVDGWAEFVHGEVIADVSKIGSFVGDAAGGSFVWEFQAVIPGMKEGQKADYFWYIMDFMDIRDNANGLVGYINNDAKKALVTVHYNGETIRVPTIQNATENDLFAWHPYWSADHGDGIYYGQQISLLCRCNCNAENCQFWNGQYCESEYWFEGEDGYWYENGFCQCWTVDQPTTFTFAYQTNDLSLVEAYGGIGHRVRNQVDLYNKIIMPNGSINGVLVANTQTYVEIPGLFQKQLTQDFDGYTANYKITINEAKLVLTNGTPLHIHDVMTQTLAYISGSLVITTEDVNGNITTLKQGVDFTVEYDGTGNKTDEKGNPVHILDITILRPQPVTYVLDYDTTLIIPTGTTQAIKYNNSASITLWGQDITDTAVEKVYADINIAAKSYKVEMFKTSALTGEPLAGATFGLYNAQGGLISTEVTNAKGELLFQTNVIEGIILREHVLYYMQEVKAPPGYQLDDTKYWFCFCDKEGDSCNICDEILADTNAMRIPFEQIGKVNAVNHILNYDLPATGGTGTLPLILVSVMFIITPLVYGFIRRRKRERRGVG